MNHSDCDDAICLALTGKSILYRIQDENVSGLINNDEGYFRCMKNILRGQRNRYFLRQDVMKYDRVDDRRISRIYDILYAILVESKVLFPYLQHDPIPDFPRVVNIVYEYNTRLRYKNELGRVVKYLETKYDSAYEWISKKVMNYESLYSGQLGNYTDDIEYTLEEITKKSIVDLMIVKDICIITNNIKEDIDYDIYYPFKSRNLREYILDILYFYSREEERLLRGIEDSIGVELGSIDVSEEGIDVSEEGIDVSEDSGLEDY